jgi:hypothetical protein
MTTRFTGFDGANVGANGFDDADGLVPHKTAGLAVFHLLVRPQIAPADAGAGDGDHCVRRLNDPSIGNVLDTNVPGSEHDSCAHK